MRQNFRVYKELVNIPRTFFTTGIYEIGALEMGKCQAMNPSVDIVKSQWDYGA